MFHLRTARRRAREVAVREALCLLSDLGATAPTGGPLSERGGVFWVSLPHEHVVTAVPRLDRLGYTSAVDLVQPAPRGAPGSAAGALVRWHGQLCRLVRLYEEDAEALRALAPDRRTFLLETAGGQVRPVAGYRGDGTTLGRRGLAVCDARMLVNLVFPGAPGAFLDPFAGTGGIAREAVAGGWRVATCDLDPALRHGLCALGAGHHVCDARDMPFGAGTVDGIATEPPYDPGTASLLPAALREMHRVLRPGGRLAILCAAWQRDLLRETAAALGLRPLLEAPIDRRGMDVAVLAWER